MTTKSTSRPAFLNGKGLTTFALIMLAMLALTVIAVYSQVSSGKTVTNGFVAGETFAKEDKLILGYRESVNPAQRPATVGKLNLGYRGGVGPAWHHGPKTSIANPSVTVVGQPILQASPQDNPELSFARRYATDRSVK